MKLAFGCIIFLNYFQFLHEMKCGLYTNETQKNIYDSSTD